MSAHTVNALCGVVWVGAMVAEGCPDDPETVLPEPVVTPRHWARVTAPRADVECFESLGDVVCLQLDMSLDKCTPAP